MTAASAGLAGFSSPDFRALNGALRAISTCRSELPHLILRCVGELKVLTPSSYDRELLRSTLGSTKKQCRMSAGCGRQRGAQPLAVRRSAGAPPGTLLGTLPVGEDTQPRWRHSPTPLSPQPTTWLAPVMPAAHSGW